MAGLLDEMRPTPRNRQLGLLADLLTKANDYAQKPDPTMPMGKANPVLGLLADAMSLKSLATTADRASYGEALTNAKKANVPFLKPETADALMMAPVSPRTALAAASMGLGSVDNGVMKAATVWHGSPHKFDKFAIAENMGKGEGAQAYGHGLYLAESPDVAGSYAQSVKANTGELIKRGAAHGLPEDVASNLAAALQSGKSFDPLLDAARKMIDNPLVPAAQQQAAQRLLDHEMPAYNAWSEWSKPGQVYKVDLPDDQIAKMLDWDKPLSQQAPEVQAAVKTTGYYDPNMTGQMVHDLLTRADEAKRMPTAEEGIFTMTTPTQRQAYAANILAKQGIPGIKFLDGGSRSAGTGTSNFVVFPGNEGLLTILERNGAPVGK